MIRTPEIAIAAARAGKVVFCEKPLANSVAEARRMLAAVEKAGVIHMLCHNYRRAPAVMLARQLIADGRLGEIRHFRGTYLQDWIVDPKFPLVWRLDRRRAGSGALGDLAAHSVDLARFLVGEIDAVAGHLETFIKQRPLPENRRKKGRVTVDDAATALVRFENGAMGTIEATRMAPGAEELQPLRDQRQPREPRVRSRAHERARGLLRVRTAATRGFRRILVTEKVHPYVKAWWPPGHIIGYEHTFTHTVFDLLEGIADDRRTAARTSPTASAISWCSTRSSAPPVDSAGSTCPIPRVGRNPPLKSTSCAT